MCLSVGSSAIAAIPLTLAVGDNFTPINNPLGNNNPIEIPVPQKQSTPTSTNVVTQETPVKVALRHNEINGNEWIDIQIPKAHEEACSKLITKICEECQNLWQHGYRDAKEDRLKKKALGVEPENNSFRIRIAYSVSKKSGLPPKDAGFDVNWQCGLFCDFAWSGVRLWDQELEKFVPTHDMTTIYNLSHECAEKVASELDKRLTKLVEEMAA